MKVKSWWNREVTWGMLVKLIICINIVWLALCYELARVGDIVDKEQQEYYNYLENRVELQQELLDLYRRDYYDR